MPGLEEKPKPDRSVTPRKKTPINTPEYWILVISNLIARFGIRGTLIIFILYIFATKGTIDQQREFIDKFILMKFDKSSPAYIVFIIVLVLIYFIWTITNLKRRIKDGEEKINELQKINHDLIQKIKK